MPTAKNWLLLLAALPARRGSARVSLWRQLRRCGAVTLKTSSYVLPDTPAHLERFQWLAQRVRDAGGEATLAHVSDIEGLADDAIVQLFNDARAADYAELIDELDRAGREARKTKQLTAPADTAAALDKLAAWYEEIRAIDFFDCPRAHDARMRLDQARLRPRTHPAQARLSPKRYAGKTWLTRPRPEIDRVGSAWLIRRFIDPKARFVFATRRQKHPDAIAFDMVGGDFTHVGDDCTFETLVRRFGLDDAAARRLAEMVHAADLDDGRFAYVECVGIDRVLKGWARQGWSDEQLLARGAELFEALYTYLRKRT